MQLISSSTNEEHYGRFETYKELSNSLKKHIPNNLSNITFLCIGTDRSTGDSFGPLVGTFLKEKGYTNVMGHINAPIHAVNLEKKISRIPKYKTVLAIDASLGRLHNVGTISFNKGTLAPGSAVSKELPEVGDYNLQGIVNVKGFADLLVLQSTKLSMVMHLAKITANAIEDAFPL